MPTTVQIHEDLKERLDRLKTHPRESYNDVIARLVDTCMDREPLSEETLAGIEEALLDIRQGRVHTEEEIRREFGAE